MAFVSVRSRTAAVVAAAVLGVGGVFAVRAPVDPVPSTSQGGGGAAVVCDQTVTTRAQLATALGNLAGTNGDTVCVTQDLSGSSISFSTDFTQEVEVVAQPLDQTIASVGITCNGCSNVTIYGFEFTGGDQRLWVDGPATNLKFVRNYCHDQQETCVNLTNGASGTTGLQVIANRIENWEAPNPLEDGKGYGVRADTPQTNAKFNYNTIGPTDTGGGDDGMEIGQCSTCEFVGNVIYEQLGRGHPLAHPDAIMFWNGSDNITYRDNRLYDSHNTLLSPDTDNAIIDNNLIVRMNQGNRCVDNSKNGTSGDVHPLNWTVTNNTIYDCDAGGWDQNIDADNARGGNVFNDNIVEGVSCEIVDGGPTQEADLFGTGNADADGNVFVGGAPVNCMSSSTNTTWTASFSDTSGHGSYVPVGLPSGYENAGYRDAPAGWDECGPTEGCTYEP